MILLDTNVVSEGLRVNPDANVVRWLNTRAAECAVSSITLFELAVGLARLPEGKRRDVLEAAITRAIRRFGRRIYSFDAIAARAAAALFERARAAGVGPRDLPAKIADLQIAGIASAYGLELATRNVADFKHTGIGLINPWIA